MRKMRSGTGWLIGLGCAGAAALLAGFLAQQIDDEMQKQELALLSEQIRSAAVGCYASEGRYPQELSYLVDHYGLIYDEERYSVMYDAFASNIMPDIAVNIRGEDGL